MIKIMLDKKFEKELEQIKSKIPLGFLQEFAIEFRKKDEADMIKRFGKVLNTTSDCWLIQCGSGVCIVWWEAFKNTCKKFGEQNLPFMNYFKSLDGDGKEVFQIMLAELLDENGL